MARKKRPAPTGASNAYLVSFGDTMTALLAFFIVLLSLAKEQTGANLHSGTGSFIQAINSFGLPGTLHTGRTNQPFQKTDVGPLYIVGAADDSKLNNVAKGPDEENNRERVVQRELEEFQRYLHEMEFSFSVKEVNETAHTTVFDLFDKLRFDDKAASILPDSAWTTLDSASRLMLDERYQIEVVVWATNPGARAMKRATLAAYSIQEEVESRYELTPSQSVRFRFMGKSWMYSHEKRPIISIAVSKMLSPENE